MRDTHNINRFREEDKTPPVIPDPGPPPPPIHPKLEQFYREIGPLRTPIDPVREARLVRGWLRQLAQEIWKSDDA
jgi:hypothetical protein